MRLVVTVDVEEDQWGWAAGSQVTVQNTREVPALQRLFEAYRVVPTYLLTFPVASDARAVALFREYWKSERCEIGMHCHPWTTPPHQEPLSRRNSMLCNLPAALQRKKLERLCDLIYRRFDRAPVAFRSGRWGLGYETVRILARLGCSIDTSITPYTSWTGSDGPDFSTFGPHPFTFAHEAFATDSCGDMLEVPVTIGYCGGAFRACDRLRKRLARAPFRQLRVAGLLGRLGLMRPVWLSPERETPARLEGLLRQSLRERCPIVNLVFHSSALQPGCTPFVQTQRQKARFLRTLQAVLDVCADLGVTSIPLSQARSSCPVSAAEEAVSAPFGTPSASGSYGSL